MDKKGSKFNYDSYTFKNDQSKPFIETLNQRNCKRTCVCSNYNENKCFECFKCKEKIHNCTKVQINRPLIHSFECMSCLARSMDLIFQPQNILLETFFRTENIFEKSNIINFEFTIKYEQTKFPVDVRCFKGNKIQLVWPMQGQFFLNGSKSHIFVLKPLKSNSNRKNRKEDNFLIQPNQLKQGLNTLTFRIPRLQKNKFIDCFQYEQTGTYYLALYSVKELTNQQVLNITQRQRRHEKASTLALFHLGDQQLPTQKQKIRLVDPYTCERIKFPVRGRYCKHVSTICLLTYISFQKRSRSWKCPICAVEVGSFLNEPYLDVWMYEILRQKDKGDSVVIYANGMHEWEDTGREVMDLDDSDDSDSQQKIKQNLEIQKIVQQQPLVLALQNIDLQSQPQQQQFQTAQQKQIDLFQYQYVIDDNQNIGLHQSLMQNNSVRDGQMILAGIFQAQRLQAQSQGQMSDGFQDMALHKNSKINIMQDQSEFNQQYPVVSNVIIDDQQIEQESRISSSNSELQYLVAQNQFIPPSIISNIIPIKQPQIEQKPSAKVPQIYSVPLQKNQKKVDKSIVKFAQKVITQKMLSIKRTNNSATLKVKGQNINKISISNNNLLQNQQKSKLNNFQNTQRKFQNDKRLIQRPNYIESKIIQPKVKSLSLPNQKQQPINIGKINRKNIQLSQAKILKTQPKTQHNPFKPDFIFPSPQTKIFKKQEPEHPKSKTIKTKMMKFDLISHSKFVKHYCNIPIPPLIRKMNDDMKRLFKNILEIN